MGVALVAHQLLQPGLQPDRAASVNVIASIVHRTEMMKIIKTTLPAAINLNVVQDFLRYRRLKAHDLARGQLVE